MSRPSCSVSLKTPSSSKLRSESSTSLLSPSWGTSWSRALCSLTWPEYRQSPPGQFQTPTSKLQWFLGFTNFYHCFICNYSSIVSPFTALTSSGVPFSWTQAIQEAFQTLKSWFTSAPIFQVPDLDCQFILEWEWGPSCPNMQSLTRSSTPVPFSLTDCHLPKEIMTSPTGSCWLSS